MVGAPMHWSNVRVPLCAVLALLALVPGLGCGSPPPKPPEVAVRPPPKPPAPAPPPPAPNVLPMLPAQLVAQLDDDAVPPFSARHGADAVVVYASHGRWMTRAIGPD